MCGINGSFRYQSSSVPITEALVTKMRDAMIHRGPDGGSTWVSDNRQVGFGHRRLSIIDLSETANQPMHTDDRRYTLTFNGEIYNHAEIREELKAIGVTLWKTSHSDTEVLMNALKVWGLDAVHRLRGMFAFAWWDSVEGTLTLVRDRIGIKPLYWSKHNGRISFASEIKALLADPDQPRAMNDTGVYYYLGLMTTPAPHTMFEGIYKLCPATVLTISASGDVSERRYWDIWDETSPLVDVPEDDIADRLREELTTAVNYRKVGDVPIGVFLSGGIDSSTNAALFARGEEQAVKTFSIGYEGEYDSYTNELHHAERMAKEINADHYEQRLTQDDMINFLPKLIDLQDEPIADPVCIPVYYVSKLARDNGVTVAQVGEGADELFWGYPWWKKALETNQAMNLPLPRFAYGMGAQMLKMKGGGWRDHRLTEMLRRRAKGEPHFFSGAETFTHLGREAVLSVRMRNDFDGASTFDSLGDTWDRYQRGAWEKTPLNWMSYVDLNLRLPELLLMRVDKMSMGVSLECRVPFLDHKFVGLGMSIPTKVKTQNGTLKHILKKAVRGIIPDDIIDRKKQGFGVPVNEWFQDRLGVHMREEVKIFMDETDILDCEGVERIWANGNSSASWWLYNLAAWHKHFIKQEPLTVA